MEVTLRVIPGRSAAEGKGIHGWEPRPFPLSLVGRARVGV
jgi:hypothetical protein